MTNDQLNEAKEIHQKINNINEALNVWDKELTAPHKMAYKQGWNNNHATSFKTENIPSELFESFRMSVMNHMEVEKSKLIKRFEKL